MASKRFAIGQSLLGAESKHLQGGTRATHGNKKLLIKQQRQGNTGEKQVTKKELGSA